MEPDMVKVRPAEIETQLEGIRKAVAHSERLYHQGIFTLAELEGARTWALRQRLGPLMTTEEHVAARESGDFERYESLMNDSRTPSAAAGEQAMRKAAAHYLADTHLNTQYASAEDQEKYAKKFHEEVKRFIDTSEFGDDADAALVEANVRMNLGETVEKPKPDNSKYDLHQVSDGDAHARDFYNREAQTPGTRQWHEHHDGSGNPRNARTGKIEKAGDFKPLDYEPPKRDDDRGFSVDRERGVMSEAEHRELDNFEQSQNAPEPAPTPEPPAPEQPVNF
jgi:hypothetical protein